VQRVEIQAGSMEGAHHWLVSDSEDPRALTFIRGRAKNF
jgi:hypothetical protein